MNIDSRDGGHDDRWALKDLTQSTRILHSTVLRTVLRTFLRITVVTERRKRQSQHDGVASVDVSHDISHDTLKQLAERRVRVDSVIVHRTKPSVTVYRVNPPLTAASVHPPSF